MFVIVGGIGLDNQFPIGTLHVPDEITDAILQDWLENIASYTRRLRDTVTSLTEEELQGTYREGAWNVRQLVHHIADSQMNILQRLKIAVIDDTPSLPNYDQDAWAVFSDILVPAESSIKTLERINARIVALAKSFTEEDLKRGFIHEKNGLITVATKIAKLYWHEEHHLAHIQIALDK